MKYLLDTRTFLWLAHQSSSLSKQAYAIIADTDNVLYLSLASVWEIQIKSQLRRLELKKSLTNIIAEQQTVNRIHLLPIALAHILGLVKLPDHHQDPFDRMLVSQALYEDIPILTKDDAINKSPVKVIW